MNRDREHIAVGVILDQSAGRVLVSRRPDDAHLGGLWEFPGGKVNHGEGIREALSRELLEELGISINKAEPLIRVNHDYPDKSVLLNTWLITGWTGVPGGMEGQEIDWVKKEQLNDLEFPQADKSIITALNLPPVYGITPDLPEYDDEFFIKLEAGLDAGLKLLQFRSRQLSAEKTLAVLKILHARCKQHHCTLLFNGKPDEALYNYIHGIHLTGNQLMRMDSRPLDGKYLVSASCHDRRELEQAGRIGVDFAVMSPVKQTFSHQDSVPMGWDKFADLVDKSCIPVYALGGMNMADIEKARLCGGQGVAMIRGLFG